MAVIGVVCKHRKEEGIRTSTRINDEVKQAVFDNGAIAIGILSPNSDIQFCSDNYKDFEKNTEVNNIIEQLKLCDGIILQGGSETEAFEIFIAKYCYDNNIPCLGICAGQNNIVRALGGTTLKIDNPEKHNKPYDKYVHSITIDENSKFYNIVNKNKINVNSRHKRTIKTCPRT